MGNREAPGNPALSRSVCRFFEIEGASGNSVAFAQVILDLPSQASLGILALPRDTP